MNQMGKYKVYKELLGMLDIVNEKYELSDDNKEQSGYPKNYKDKYIYILDDTDNSLFEQYVSSTTFITQTYTKECSIIIYLVLRILIDGYNYYNNLLDHLILSEISGINLKMNKIINYYSENVQELSETIDRPIINCYEHEKIYEILLGIIENDKNDLLIY